MNLIVHLANRRHNVNVLPTKIHLFQIFIYFLKSLNRHYHMKQLKNERIRSVW